MNWNDEVMNVVNEVEGAGAKGFSNTQDVPTIATSAVLVSLSIGVPTLTKKDKRASEEVIYNNNAKRGAANVTKKLVSSDVHDSIKQLVGQVRAFHRDATIPWGDLGARLLPNTLLIDYRNRMNDYQREFEQLRDDFLDIYPSEVAQAQVTLGDLFDETDYPSVYDLEQKFRMGLGYEPLPDSGDFRLDINNEAQAELRSQYEDVMRERLKDAMDDVWQRLLEPLKNMSARLEYDVDGKPLNGHFKGTIVDNVMDIVDLMKHVNIAKDPRMEQVRQDLVHALRGVSYEGLKDSETLRIDTKRKVDDIIKTLPTLDW
jgi:hypothetical protein